MCDSTILVICFYNGKTMTTETYVKYVGNKAVIVSLDVTVDSTFDQLSAMIYSRTDIEKKRYQLFHNCRYPLKSGNRFQPCPIWDDNSVYRMMKLANTTGIEEIESYLGLVGVKPSESISGYLHGFITWRKG